MPSVASVSMWLERAALPAFPRTPAPGHEFPDDIRHRELSGCSRPALAPDPPRREPRDAREAPRLSDGRAGRSIRFESGSSPRFALSIDQYPRDPRKVLPSENWRQDRSEIVDWLPSIAPSEAEDRDRRSCRDSRPAWSGHLLHAECHECAATCESCDGSLHSRLRCPQSFDGACCIGDPATGGIGNEREVPSPRR